MRGTGKLRTPFQAQAAIQLPFERQVVRLEEGTLDQDRGLGQMGFLLISSVALESLFNLFCLLHRCACL